MFSLREKLDLTKATIMYSDEYEYNFELFNRGIKILDKRICDEDYSEFSDDDREILEEIFTTMES